MNLFSVTPARFLAQGARRVFFRAALSAFLLVSLAAGPLLAQARDIRFEQISIERGLSQSIVQTILQDRCGFMWFGTEDGLNKFDGYSFRIFRHDPDDPASLAYNQVLSICEDRQGFIWAGTFQGGLDRLDPSTGRFRHFVHVDGDAASLSYNTVNSIVEDRHGILWIGTDDGLNRLNAKDSTFTRYYHDPSNPNSLSHNFILRIYEDRSGAIWIGTQGGGLCSFDPTMGVWTSYRHDPRDPSSLGSDVVRSIGEDINGTLWVGTVGGGLCRLDRTTNTFERFTHDPSNPRSLSHNDVYDIHEDQAGTLWFATNGGGLCRLDSRAGVFTRYLHDSQDPTSISYNEIYDIFEDRGGVLWLGTYGGGIDKFDTKRKKFTLYRPDLSSANTLGHEIVWSILEEDSGILWVGTHGDGLNRLDRRTGVWTRYRHNAADPTSLSHDIVRIIFKDRAGTLWIGTNGGGICSFDRRTGRFKSYRNDPSNPRTISFDQIRTIYEDREGTMWVGTNGGGLCRFDRASGAFTCYRSKPGDTKSLSNDYIRTIHEDRTGNFWIGTQGGGLELFDRATGVCTHHRANPGDPKSLSNDYIFSIFEDSRGIMWIGTWGGGLSKFDRETSTFTHYTMKNGLPNNSIYGMLEDDEGNLWLSTNFGLSKFNPYNETFKNYTEDDGLQSNEFNGGSFFESPSGEMFFGGIHGFNSFNPRDIVDNMYAPPVVITMFRKLNEPMSLGNTPCDVGEVKLSHGDYTFSFEFAALDYTAPMKNLYAYMMEGLDADWIYTTADKRIAAYTTLPPGSYVFRVKGSNSDGVWNERGVSIAVAIAPPFWRTLWFQALAAAVIVALAVFFYRWRLKDVRITAELEAAHAAQMSIMPGADPLVTGFDISGTCIPASEVGGDFYDYFWLDRSKGAFGVAVADVSGKAMNAAMIAVMSNGMIASKIGETTSVAEFMTKLNRPLHAKTAGHVFTALCLLSLDTERRTATFANAGLCTPLMKSGGAVTPLESDGPRLPLGGIEDTVYAERSVTLKRGDTIFVFSDGLTDARGGSGEHYGEERLREAIKRVDPTYLSAREMKDAIVEEALTFGGKAQLADDLTLVVIKAV